MVAVGGAVLWLLCMYGGSAGLLAAPVGGNEWQAAHLHEGLWGCFTHQRVRGSEVPQDSQPAGLSVLGRFCAAV